MSFPVSDRLITRIVNEEVEEYLYADQDTLSTTLVNVEDDTIPDGYEGLIVSVAVSSEKTAILYIERDGKQYYENGLNCAGLSSILETAGTDREGVGDEVPLLIRIKEQGKWALGFKATAATPTISWRLRVRHFKVK